MASFKGVSEKFRVSMTNSDGHTERVTVQIGLEGLKVLTSDGSRAMRSYDLSHISRWQSNAGSLILYTKTPVDVEERQLTLTGDEYTIRSALDTLTSCCMQLAELLQSGRTAGDLEAANNLHALVSGGGRKKTTLPTADTVEYWKQPDKAGWLQSQADVTKLWRKRWFVLKQGFLFRFLDDKVSESTKPRGVVDLGKVQDLRDGRPSTGRPNSLQLKTASGGSVCYICDSETEQVEWMSALEGAMQKILKRVAGVEEDSKSSQAQQWAKQMERNIDRPTASSSDGGRRHQGGGSSGLGSQYVEVVGYEALGGGAGGSSGYGSNGYGVGSSGISYGQISGVAGVVGGPMDDTSYNYNGYAAGAASGYQQSSSSSYAQPSTSMPYQHQQQGSYFPQQQAQQQQQQQQQQQVQVQPQVSILDQIPAQQPAYPYFQQGSAPQAPSAPPPGQWQVHYTAEGRPYYYNSVTGVTQWEAPPGM